MKIKKKISLIGSKTFKNENYIVTVNNYNGKILLKEKGKEEYFLDIRYREIEKFHIKNILKRFGFELVEGYTVIDNEKEFLEHFKGKIGLAKNNDGEYEYRAYYNRGIFNKEYIEEVFNVIINF